MAVSILFVGCTPKGLEDNPPTDANVVSNGGMTVVKGDYLYFVNGFVDETSLSEYDNKSGKVIQSGIYRTKLTDGKINKDKDGFLTNCDQVVSKVVGFSNGGFYIIDDYIYYATPYMNLDSSGIVQNSRVEFHKININGTEDKTLYVTEKSEDNLDWTVYKVGGNVYIVAYVDSKIVIVNTQNTKDIKTLADTTSYAFLQEEDYVASSTRNNELQNYIYYTRSTTTDDNYNGNFKGNIVGKINVATGEKTEGSASKDFTYSIVAVKDNRIYYTKTNSRYSGKALLYVKDVSTLSWDNAEEVKLSDYAYSNYFVCDFGLNLVIADDSTGTYVLENGTVTKISSTQKTILGMSGNYAYYLSDSSLYAFDIRGNVNDGEIECVEITNSDITHQITNENYIDFDGQRVYVYAQYTSASGSTNYYLNYIEGDKERFVGKFEDSHLPEEPEQDEDYGEDADVKYIPWIDD